MATEWEIKIWDGDPQIWPSQTLYHVLIIIKPLNIPINSRIVHEHEIKDTTSDRKLLVG